MSIAPSSFTGPVTFLRTKRDGSSFEVVIDAQDVPVYQRHAWQRHAKGLIRYMGTKKGQGSILLHREILNLPANLYIAFRNGNPFDVRRENMEVITKAEQRVRMQAAPKPPFNTRSRVGLVGVRIYETVHRHANGTTSIYRQAHTQLSHQGKVYTKGFSVDVLGEHEAKRRALAWRVQKIQDLGMEPNAELLAELEHETAQAEANPYSRPPRPAKPPKPPKLAWLPKPPKPPRLPRPRRVPVPKVPKLKLPKVPKPKRPRRTRTRATATARLAAASSANAPVPCMFMDLPDGIVAVEHETMFSGKTISLLLDATDLHFYQQRRWMVQDGGILCSGMGRDQIRLHRLIIGATPGERVRFRNGNTFDFRRENLVLGGICRNVFGLTAHGVYPFYVKRGTERVLWGMRTVVVPPGRGIARERRLWRHFSFEKYGEQEAKRRAYTLRIETMEARGETVPDDLRAALESITTSSDHGDRPVSKRTAGFFRMLSVGGALTK